MEETANSKKTDKPWLFQPGQSGNPSGRPKNTMKDYLRRKFMELSDEEKEQFLKENKVPGVDQIKLAEGNPHQSTDQNLDIKGSPIVIVYDRSNKDISRLPVEDTGRQGAVHSSNSGSPVGEDNSGSSMVG